MIPDHGNRQKRRTWFNRYLFKSESDKYQNFNEVFESDQDQETTRKPFHEPPKDIKPQLTRPFATASNYSLIGWNGIWQFPVESTGIMQRFFEGGAYYKIFQESAALIRGFTVFW